MGLAGDHNREHLTTYASLKIAKFLAKLIKYGLGLRTLVFSLKYSTTYLGCAARLVSYFRASLMRKFFYLKLIEQSVQKLFMSLQDLFPLVELQRSATTLLPFTKIKHLVSTAS